MFCVKCGKDIGDADYCTYCGEKSVKEIETEIAPQTEKSENDKPEVKSGKSKRGFIVASCIIALLLIAGAAFTIIFLNRPTQEISFDEVVESYSSNAANAKDTYNGNKFIFYFTVDSIDSNGTCKGTVYDSNMNTLDEIIEYNGELVYQWKVRFSLSDAKKLEKGKTYKIEGYVNFNYKSVPYIGDGFYNNNIYSAEIISEVK